MRLNVFDATCQIGRHQKLKAGDLHTAADLLAEMDHFGISEALVIDPLARECHPAIGNERIVKETASHPRLHPVWSALPHGPESEQPEPETYLHALKQAQVGAVFLFPRQYRFTLDDWCVDALVEPLAEAGVPIVVDYTEIGPGGIGNDVTDWNAVVGLCRRFPELNVIVTESRIRRSQRLAYKAMDAAENLRLTLSPLWLHRSIEYITETWGAERLIYGTRWPQLGAGITLPTLTTAEISDLDKQRIAGDNLRELVSWADVEHPDVELPEPADEFVAFAQTGERPAEMTFADNHGHLGGYGSHYHIPGGDLDATVRDMDRLGVEKVCVFSFTGVYSDEVYGNDVIIDAVQRYPDRFVGFTMLNPHRGERDMLRELERCQAAGLRGVKFIPSYQGYPEEGPLIDVGAQWAHEHKQCILNHDWGGPEQMERLVSTYPGACFFTGHTTLAFADIMKRYDNLYVCSCPLLSPRICEDVVAAVGADRFMFGSDLQDLPIAWGLGPILCARITPAEKRLILGGNIRRVLTTHSQP